MKLTRLCDVPDGTVIRLQTTIYRVKRKEGKIRLHHMTPTATTSIEYGLNCQMWVEVVEDF